MGAFVTSDAIEIESDAALLRRYTEHGERGAMGRLLLRHHRTAWALACSYGLPEASADDAVQTAFVAVIAAASSFAGASTVRSWLLGFVVNASRDGVRLQRRQGEHEAMPAIPAASRGRAGTSEPIAAILDQLRTMPVRYRRPLELRYLHGFEPGEIEATLHDTALTVRSRLSRGLAKLRLALLTRGLALDDEALASAIASLPMPTPSQRASVMVAEWVRSGALPMAKAPAPAGMSLAMKAMIIAAAVAVAGAAAMLVRRSAL
jgi:RNA polymerase sigma-70 factor (ECF subfamily)